MAINVAVFGAFLLMALVFGFFLWQTLFASKEYSGRETESKSAYSEQQGGNEDSLKSSIPPSASKPATDEAIAKYTKWLAIFTMFLVLATLGLFISGERSVEVAGRSANAAKDSAKAAQNAVELADKTAARQLRAYVWVKMTTVRYPPKEPDRIGIGFEMTNSGQTWAQNITIRTAIIPRQFNTEYDPWDRAQWKVSTPMVLGPHQSVGLQLDNIWLTDIPSILLGNKGFDYAIWITYEDTLTQPPILRQTQLCQRFNADKEGGTSFAYLPPHNCADDNCP